MNASLAALFIIVSSVASFAQAPPTVEEALHAHHIQTSLEGLKRALRSADPVVRGLAALEIADRGDRSQIPALREALQRERDDHARLNLSRALNHLGDPDGRAGLEDACADRRMRPDLRIISADELIPDVGDTCFSALVDVLSSSENAAVRQAALYSLERAKPSLHAMEQNRDLLASALSRALDDSVPSVRKGASKNIAIYRITSVRTALIEAFKREEDPSTKAVIEDSLRSLSK